MARSSPPFELIRIAAELRAAGTSWDAISTKVHRSVRACKRWPYLYAREWAEAFARAFCIGLTEAGVEAFLFLRKHGRSDDARLSQDTSKFMMKSMMDGLKRLLETAQLAEKKSKWSAYIAFLEKLGDDDAKRLVDGFVAQRMAERNGAPGGTMDDAGTAIGA